MAGGDCEGRVADDTAAGHAVIDGAIGVPVRTKVKILDYETPPRRPNPDRVGFMSVWMVLASLFFCEVGVIFAGARIHLAADIMMVLIFCTSLAGAVLAWESLARCGLSWRATVGICVNGLILIWFAVATA